MNTICKLCTRYSEHTISIIIISNMQGVVMTILENDLTSLVVREGTVVMKVK